MPSYLARRSAPRYRRRLVTAKNVGTYGAMVRDEYTKLAAGRKLRTKTATRLMQKKKRNPMVRSKPIPAQGGMPSFSQWKLSRPASRRVLAKKKVAAANFYVTNGAYQIIASEGFQNAAQVSFQSLADLKQIATYLPAAALPVTPKEYVLESSTCEFLVTNSSLATAYVDIYDIVRKRDTGISNNTTDSPINAWATGVNHETTTGVDPFAWQNINGLPTDSRCFKDYFKVIKRTHIGLAQGAVHRHSVKIKANELVDTELLSQANGDLAGVTVYTMMVVYGQPASITGETGTIVTTAKIALDVVYSQRYKYTWVSDNSNSFYYTDNLSTLAGEQVVSAGAGAIVPNAII